MSQKKNDEDCLDIYITKMCLLKSPLELALQPASIGKIIGAESIQHNNNKNPNR